MAQNNKMTVTVAIKTFVAITCFWVKGRYWKEKSKLTVFLPYSTLKSDVESQIKYFVIRAKLPNLICKSSKIK